MITTTYMVREQCKHPEVFDAWLKRYTERIISETLESRDRAEQVRQE